MNLYVQTKDNILKKINSNDFNFTEDELFIIGNNKKIASLVIEKILENVSVLENSNIIILIYDYGTPFSDLFKNITKSHDEIIKKITMPLYRNKISLSYVLSGDLKYKLTSKQKEEIKELYTKLFKDSNFKFYINDWFGNNTDRYIEFLKEFIIPYKRMDLFNTLYENWRGFSLPKDFVVYLENKYLTDKTNFDLIDGILLFLNGNERFYYFIIDKIKHIDNFTVEDTLAIWKDVLAKLNKTQRENIYEIAMEKGVVEFFLIKNSRYFEFLKSHNLMGKFDLIYKSKSHTRSMFIENASHFDILKNKEDIMWLLEHGYFEFVLSFDFDDLVHDTLINYITNNKNKFKDYTLPIIDDLELIELFIEIKYQETEQVIDFTELLKLFYKNNNENLSEIFNLLDFIINDLDKNTTFDIENLTKLFTSNFIIADMFIDYFLDIIILNNDILKFYVSVDNYFVERILNRVLHNEDYNSFYNHETYLILKDYLSKKYNVTKENLDLLENAFGPLIIKFIDNENIQELLKLPKHELIKIINIFPNLTYTKKDAETLYDTIKQYEYTKVHQTEVNLFTMFKEALQNGEKNKINELIIKLTSYLTNPDFIKRFPKYKDVNFNIYLKEVCSLFNSNKEETLTIIRSIINDYLAFSREEYRKTYDLYNDCKIKEITPSDGNEKAVCLGLLDELNTITISNLSFIRDAFDIDVRDIIKKIGKRVQEEFDKEHKNNSYKLMFDTVDLLKFYVYGNKAVINSQYISDIKKCVKYLGKIIKEFNNPLKEEFIRLAKWKHKIKVKTIHIIEQNDDIYQILTTLNIPALVKNVLSSDDIYNSLVNIMKKYKLHKIPVSFKEILSSDTINLGDTLDNLGDFISNYYLSYMDVKVISEKKDIVIPLIKILKDINVYGVSSNIYSMILTSKDARLIKSNPGPNAAFDRTKGNERLNDAVNYTLECFKRDKVCVPTLNEVIDLGGKKLRVVVGNFTNPCNITHGERTGACMRIGGHAHSLFDFIIKDPHGFHIRFEDAETHEYVSRVSGFRNGNTVFLNELRFSLSKFFTNSDVFNACKIISDMLIKESKKSNYPIDNVLLVPQYIGANYQSVPINETNLNITKGLGKFYTDYCGRAIIVSTTSKVPNELVPINYDNKEEVYYLPARDEVREVKDLTEFTIFASRINALKSLLNGEDLLTVSALYINDFVYGIVNNDFYIYINTKGEIKYDIIIGDERALIELEDARTKVIKEAKKLGIEVLSL